MPTHGQQDYLPVQARTCLDVGCLGAEAVVRVTTWVQNPWGCPGSGAVPAGCVAGEACLPARAECGELPMGFTVGSGGVRAQPYKFTERVEIK